MVVFMRCVPLLIMIRNVALAMVTEVFTPVEVARNARLENTVEVHEVGGRGVDPRRTASRAPKILGQVHSVERFIRPTVQRETLR